MKKYVYNKPFKKQLSAIVGSNSLIWSVIGTKTICGLWIHMSFYLLGVVTCSKVCGFMIVGVGWITECPWGWWHTLRSTTSGFSVGELWCGVYANELE